MNKDQIFMYLAGTAVAIACVVIWSTASQTEFKISSDSRPTRAAQRAIASCKNATWDLDGNSFNLKLGNAEVASTSESLTFARRAARGYVDSDNFPDLVCLYTLKTGGTGTFYYFGYLKGLSQGMYQPQAMQLLGDRVAVSNLSIEGNRIHASWDERKLETPFSSPPDLNHVKHWGLEGDELVVFFDSANGGAQ